MEQRTDEWLSERAGKVTASRIADVLAKTKTGYGAGRANYMADLVAERLTGVPKQGFTNAAMQWGTETEPQARAMYELERGVTVVEEGFVRHPTLANTGASPPPHHLLLMRPLLISPSENVVYPPPMVDRPLTSIQIL